MTLGPGLTLSLPVPKTYEASSEASREGWTLESKADCPILSNFSGTEIPALPAGGRELTPGIAFQ